MPFDFTNLWLITDRHRYCTYHYYLAAALSAASDSGSLISSRSFALMALLRAASSKGCRFLTGLGRVCSSSCHESQLCHFQLAPVCTTGTRLHITSCADGCQLEVAERRRRHTLSHTHTSSSDIRFRTPSRILPCCATAARWSPLPRPARCRPG